MTKSMLLIIAVSILVTGCSRKADSSGQSVSEKQSDYERGKADALADLKAGRPRYFLSGKPLSADSKLVDILKDDYGVHLVCLGCVAIPPVAEHVKGYNEVVLSEMNHRFGKDIFQAAWQEDVEQRDRKAKEILSGATINPAQAYKNNKLTARKQMKRLEFAIELFFLDQGRLPSSLQDLARRPTYVKDWPEEGYIKNGIPKDPWGHDYIYRVPGDGNTFDIICVGADGRPGGEGDNADIMLYEKAR